MTVFQVFPQAIEQATLVRVDATDPLGETRETVGAVDVIIDEGTATGVVGSIRQETDSMRVYARADGLCGSKDCVGDLLEIENTIPRTLRIDAWQAGKDQKDGVMLHVELTCSEVAS